MERFPNVGRACECIQLCVINLDEAALFQVWSIDSPTTAQISIQTVAEDIAQSAIDLLASEADGRVCGISLEREIQSSCNFLGNSVVTQSSIAGGFGCFENGGPQQAYFNKIVEMSRL